MRHGMVMNTSDSKIAEEASLDDAILAVLADTGAKTLSPPEIAHAIAGDGDWHDLLMPIRILREAHDGDRALTGQQSHQPYANTARVLRELEAAAARAPEAVAA